MAARVRVDASGRELLQLSVAVTVSLTVMHCIAMHGFILCGVAEKAQQFTLFRRLRTLFRRCAHFRC